MVGITEAMSAYQALKAAKDIATGMVAVHDAATIRAKAGELNAKLIEAQGAIFAVNEERTTLVETIRELKDQLLRFENWEAEKNRYELHKLEPSGAFVYRLKPDAEPQEPTHDLCASCYQERKKSILQADPRIMPAYTMLKCHSCGSEVLLSGHRRG